MTWEAVIVAPLVVPRTRTGWPVVTALAEEAFVPSWYAVEAVSLTVTFWPAEVASNRVGARLVTEHLLSLGHVRIAMISGPEALRTSGERELGYLEAVNTAGVKPQ